MEPVILLYEKNSLGVSIWRKQRGGFGSTVYFVFTSVEFFYGL
jgi:hypothetical protein